MGIKQMSKKWDLLNLEPLGSFTLNKLGKGLENPLQGYLKMILKVISKIVKVKYYSLIQLNI